MSIRQLVRHVSRNWEFVIGMAAVLGVLAGLAVGSTTLIREMTRPDASSGPAQTELEAVSSTSTTDIMVSSGRIGIGTASVSGYVIAPPDSVAIYGTTIRGTETLVTVYADGEMTFGPHYTPSKAARAFWRSVGKLAPCRPKR